MGSTTFSCLAPSLWNSLPPHLRHHPPSCAPCTGAPLKVSSLAASLCGRKVAPCHAETPLPSIMDIYNMYSISPIRPSASHLPPPTLASCLQTPPDTKRLGNSFMHQVVRMLNSRHFLPPLPLSHTTPPSLPFWNSTHTPPPPSPCSPQNRHTQNRNSIKNLSRTHLHMDLHILLLKMVLNWCWTVTLAATTTFGVVICTTHFTNCFLTVWHYNYIWTVTVAATTYCATVVLPTYCYLIVTWLQLTVDFWMHMGELKIKNT